MDRGCCNRTRRHGWDGGTKPDRRGRLVRHRDRRHLLDYGVGLEPHPGDYEPRRPHDGDDLLEHDMHLLQRERFARQLCDGHEPVRRQATSVISSPWDGATHIGRTRTKSALRRYDYNVDMRDGNNVYGSMEGPWDGLPEHHAVILWRGPPRPAPGRFRWRGRVRRPRGGWLRRCGRRGPSCRRSRSPAARPVRRCG